MSKHRSGAVGVCLSEVVGFRDDGVLAASVALVELLLVGGLNVDSPLGVNQLVTFEHGGGANSESSTLSVDGSNVRGVVDLGTVHVGA